MKRTLIFILIAMLIVSTVSFAAPKAERGNQRDVKFVDFSRKVRVEFTEEEVTFGTDTYITNRASFYISSKENLDGLAIRKNNGSDKVIVYKSNLYLDSLPLLGYNVVYLEDEITEDEKTLAYWGSSTYNKKTNEYEVTFLFDDPVNAFNLYGISRAGKSHIYFNYGEIGGLFTEEAPIEYTYNTGTVEFYKKEIDFTEEITVAFSDVVDGSVMGTFFIPKHGNALESLAIRKNNGTKMIIEYVDVTNIYDTDLVDTRAFTDDEIEYIVYNVDTGNYEVVFDFKIINVDSFNIFVKFTTGNEYICFVAGDLEYTDIDNKYMFKYPKESE